MRPTATRQQWCVHILGRACRGGDKGPAAARGAEPRATGAAHDCRALRTRPSSSQVWHLAFANDEDLQVFRGIVNKARQPCPGVNHWVANQWCPGAADALNAPQLPADGANLALRVGMEVNGGGYKTENVGADLANEHGLYTQPNGFGSRPDLFLRYYGIVFFEEEVAESMFPVYSAHGARQFRRDGQPRPLKPAPACDAQVHGAFDGLYGAGVERPLISPILWDGPPGDGPCFALAEMAPTRAVVLPAVGQLYEACTGQGEEAIARVRDADSLPDRAQLAHTAVATWAVPMLKGLAYMHDTMGVVHGDFKPEQARARVV